MFTEPLSIVEKGIEGLRTIQSRLPWFYPHPGHDWLSDDWGGCKVALVMGAGSLGLLATALMRLAGTFTYVADVVSEDHIKVKLVGEMGADYIDSRGKSAEEIVTFCCTPTGELNVIFEASGAAEEAIRLIPFMSRNGIYAMTGIPLGDIKIELDAAQLVSRIVRFNQVVFGSVNSNRRHFEMALRDINKVNMQFKGMLEEIITRRVRFKDYEKAFAPPGPEHVKTVMEIEAWE